MKILEFWPKSKKDTYSKVLPLKKFHDEKNEKNSKGNLYIEPVKKSFEWIEFLEGCTFWRKNHRNFGAVRGEITHCCHFGKGLKPTTKIVWLYMGNIMVCIQKMIEFGRIVWAGKAWINELQNHWMTGWFHNTHPLKACVYKQNTCIFCEIIIDDMFRKFE